MFDFGSGNFCTFGCQFQFLVIMRRSAVFDVQLGDDHIETFFFEVFVGKAVDAEQFRSSQLKINRKNAVMDDAGLVGFAVSWDDSYRVRLNRCFFRKFHNERKSYQIPGKIQDSKWQKKTASGKNRPVLLKITADRLKSDDK